jgi:hypothetical protein
VRPQKPPGSPCWHGLILSRQSVRGRVLALFRQRGSYRAGAPRKYPNRRTRSRSGTTGGAERVCRRAGAWTSSSPADGAGQHCSLASSRSWRGGFAYAQTDRCTTWPSTKGVDRTSRADLACGVVARTRRYGLSVNAPWRYPASRCGLVAPDTEGTGHRWGFRGSGDWEGGLASASESFDRTVLRPLSGARICISIIVLIIYIFFARLLSNGVRTHLLLCGAASWPTGYRKGAGLFPGSGIAATTHRSKGKE